MQRIFLHQDIPQHYKESINQVQSKVIIKLLSQFKFFSLSITNNNENYDDAMQIETKLENYLFNYLKEFKFITIRFFNTNNVNDESNLSQQNLSVIICVEGECIIIEKIQLSPIIKIIDQLQKQNISVLNISSNSLNNDTNDYINSLKSEIEEFSSFLLKRNSQNDLIKSIIEPILCYSIQRYFYPTNYFKDASFFIFDKIYESKEQEIKAKINEFLHSTDYTTKLQNLSEIEELIKKEIKDKTTKNQKLVFKEEDFFYFRKLPPSNQYSFYLVIHLDSFYPFIIKKLIDSNNYSKQMRAVDFCQNYPHRCLTQFYGILESEGKEVGVVYEYLCNNTLSSYIHEQRPNDLFSLMTINRIFQGIEFLHSNNFVDRDLKPSNVLLDHNFLPYISDFETIRHPSDEQMTGDVGSSYYISPEQEKNENVSLETDIYSFGLMIYFIFTRKDMFDSKSTYEIIILKNKGEILQMQNGPNNFRKLYKKCLNLQPDERPSLEEIKSVIIEEVCSFYYFENLLQQRKSNIKIDEITNFIYESFIILSNDIEKMKKYEKLIILFGILLNTKINENDSSLFLKLGNSYYNGYGVHKDLLKAKEYFGKAAQLHNLMAIQKLKTFYHHQNNKTNKNQISKYRQSDPYIIGYMHFKGILVKTNYDIARQYFEKSAELNNSDAQLYLGFIYFHGLGVELNNSIALKYFEQSAQQNNTTGHFMVGSMYYEGYGVEKDYIKAREHFEYAAKYNDSDALMNLGKIYYYGSGVKRNYSKAREYFELSAKQDNSFAQYYLGIIFYFGYEVERNYFLSYKYFKLSIKQQNIPYSYYFIGIMYSYGYGVKQNYEEARKNFEMAIAEHEIPDAFFSLGKIYYYGHGVEKDYNKSREYLEKAAEFNFSDALNQLGQFYRFGVGVKKDISKALDYYRKAAKLNNPDALFNLGYIYYEGFDCVRDILLAIHYYELAGKYNNANALNNLGMIYCDPNIKDVERDYSKALKYYEMAASKNNGLAYWHLGGMYQEGTGVEKNYSKAKEYYEISSRYNNSLAFLSLGNLYANGYGVPKNYKEAIKNYEYANGMGDIDALYFIGSIYSNRDDFERDIVKSIKYFKKSIELTINKYSKYNSIEEIIYNSSMNKGYYLHSYNDLGLIYVTVFNDIMNGFNYIKIAADGELPFAECNLGLLYQYFLEPINIEEAKYRYKKSSKYNFTMSEFNLGQIYEKEGRTEKSIEYFKMASDHEDEPLIFHCNAYNDNNLEISKTFIICLTNLKLTHYFFLNENYEEAKKYFIRSFNKLKLKEEDNIYQFNFPFDEKVKTNQNPFTYLRKYIFNFPLFNLKKQPNIPPYLISENQFQIDISDCKPVNEIINQKFNMKNNFLKKCFEFTNNHNSENEPNIRVSEDKIIFKDLSDLFDFVLDNEHLKDSFIDEIRSMIELMSNILYRKPYYILFGRINIWNQKEKIKDTRKHIDEIFYDGFSND